MSKDNKRKLSKKFARVLSVFLSCAIAVSSFAPVVYATDGAQTTSDTHVVTHQIFMGSGNMCEVPAVGTTADVAIGEIFGVKFYDNGELIDIEKVSVSNEGFVAAGFEVTCVDGDEGCNRIDLKATSDAELGEAKLYFTITFDDGTAVYPTVSVNVVGTAEEEESSSTDPDVNNLTLQITVDEKTYTHTESLETPIEIQSGSTYTVTAVDQNGNVITAQDYFSGYSYGYGENGDNLGDGDIEIINWTDSTKAGYEFTIAEDKISDVYSVTLQMGTSDTGFVDYTYYLNVTQPDGVWLSKYWTSHTLFKGTAFELAQDETLYFYVVSQGKRIPASEISVEQEQTDSATITVEDNGEDFAHLATFNYNDVSQTSGVLGYNIAADGTTWFFSVCLPGTAQQPSLEEIVANFGITTSWNFDDDGFFHVSNTGTATMEITANNVPDGYRADIQTGSYNKVDGFTMDMVSPYGVYPTRISSDYSWDVTFKGEELAQYSYVQDNGYIYVAVRLIDETTGDVVAVNGFDVFVDGVTSGGSSGDAGNEDVGDNEGQDKEFQDFNGVIEYIYLNSGDQPWNEYDEAFEVSPSSYIGFRFKHAGSNEYIDVDSIEKQDTFSKIFSDTFEDGAGTIWNAVGFEDADISGYTLQFNIEDQYVAYVTVLVTDGKYYGSAMPAVNNTQSVYANLILGSEQSFTDTYHGTTQGSMTGVKFYTANGAPISAGAVSVLSCSEDFAFWQATSDDGYGYWQLQANGEARVGYHKVTFHVENYGDYTMLLYVNEYVDTTPDFSGTIQWLDVTDLEDGEYVESWNTIPNGGTINLEISSKFAVRFMGNDGNLVNDNSGGYDGKGLGGDTWTDGEGDMYSVWYMNNLPADSWNFYYYLQDGSKATFNVQTTDNTGVYLKVYNEDDDLVGFTDLIMPQNGSVGIYLLYSYGEFITYENITSATVSPLDNQTICPRTFISTADCVYFHANNEEGFADPGRYLATICANGEYKSFILYVREQMIGEDSQYFSTEMPEMTNDGSITVNALTGPSDSIERQDITNTYFGSTQGSGLALEFFENGELVSIDNIAYVDGSPAIDFSYGEGTRFDGLDIDLNSNAAIGYHTIIFNVNNKNVQVVVHASEYIPVEPPQYSSNPDEHYYGSEDEAKASSDYMQEFSGHVMFLTGSSENPDKQDGSSHIFETQAGGMFGLMFNTVDGSGLATAVDPANISVNADKSSPYIETRIGEESGYGCIDVFVKFDAPAAYHFVTFVVDGSEWTLIVLVNSSSGSDSGLAEYEEEWPGTLEIAPSYNWGEDPAESSWKDYDTFMKNYGGLASYGGHVYAVRLKDGDGNVVSTDFYSWSNGDVMCRPSDDKTYYITYHGEKDLIGTYQNTYLVKDLYTDTYKYGKTITVRNEYAQGTETRDGDTEVRIITLRDYNGSIRFADETFDYVIINLEGNNTIDAPSGEPVFDVAGDLSISGTGNLTINFFSAEGKTTAIKAGGSIDSDHSAIDTNGTNRTITINDVGTTVTDDNSSETSYYGANIVIGSGWTEIHGSDYVIDGDFIVDNEEDEEVYIEGSGINAENIRVNGTLSVTEGSKIDAYTIITGQDFNVSDGSDVSLVDEDGNDEIIGIRANNISIVNSIVEMNGINVLYNEELKTNVAVYAEGEIYIEHIISEDGLSSEPLFNIIDRNGAENPVYAVAAKGFAMIGGTATIKALGYNATALYTFGNGEDDYGTVIHEGQVNINGFNGIVSNKDIQLGNPDEGKAVVTVNASNGCALAVDPEIGGRIILENTDIVLKGSKGAIQARYVTEGEDGWYDFGYNSDIWVKAGASAEDAEIVYDYESIEGKTYVATAQPDENAKITISFISGDAEYELKNMSKVIGNMYGTLPIPFKKGYRFAGWAKHNEFGELEYVDEGDRVPAADTVLYAQWEAANANTYYLDGINTDWYELDTEYNNNFIVDVGTTNITVQYTGYNYIKWAGSHAIAKYNEGNLTIKGYDEGSELVIESIGTGYAVSAGVMNAVTFTNGNVYIEGGITGNNIVFNKGYFDIYSDMFFALHITGKGYGKAGSVVVNNGATVSVCCEGDYGAYLTDSTLTVNKGGKLVAVGRENGIYAETISYAVSAKITIAEGANVIAQGNKAAMKADSINLSSKNKMVAGFSRDTAQKVKTYSGERYFAAGKEFAVEGWNELNYVVVNGCWFSSDEEEDDEYFHYVPDTTYMGEEGVNVLYLKPGFKFVAPSDIYGIESYIFACEDIVITSADADNMTVTERDWLYHAPYSLYALGDVRINQVTFGETDMSVYAGSLFVDSCATLKASDLDINGDFRSMVARVDVEHMLEVNGDVTLAGMNNEEGYDVYNISANAYNWEGCKIKGDLKLLGVTFNTVNEIYVVGNVETSSANINAKYVGDYEYVNAAIIADGNITINNYSNVDSDLLVGNNIVVNENAAVTALEIDGTNVTINGGEVVINDVGGYNSLNASTAITISGGDVKVAGGVSANKVTISGGNVEIADSSVGIDAGIVTIKGGVVDIDAAQTGIAVRKYDKTSALTVTGGTVNIEAGEFAVYLTKGTKATFNSSKNKNASQLRLYGEKLAIYGGGTVTAYGSLTAANEYDDLEIVSKYNGEKYLYVNVKTHYNVTFHPGSQDTFVQKTRVNECVEIPDIAEMTGYTFTGRWITEDQVEWNFSTPITCDVELHAVWEPNRYNVTYWTGECNHAGTHDTSDYVVATDEVCYDDVYGELPVIDYVREGHKFVGWSTVEGDTSSIVTAETVVKTASDHDLYAVWELETYTVTLDANEGKFVEGLVGKDTINVEIPYYHTLADMEFTAPKRAYCDFVRWYICDEETDEWVEYDPTTPVTEDITLYADWIYYNTVEDVVVSVVSNGEEKVLVTTPADSDEMNYNEDIKVGDRIVIRTATAGADIRFMMANPNGFIVGPDEESESVAVYTQSIEITKDMLVPNEEFGDDVLALMAFAEREFFNPSNKTVVYIKVDSDRDVWGDITETDKALVNTDGNGDGIIDALDVPDYMWIANVPAEVEYTGSAIKIDEMRVYDNKTLLTLNKDYTVAYKNNTNAGAATITVKGKGAYADTLTETFTITPMEIDGSAESGAVFETQLNATVKTFNNKVQKPTVKFLKDGKALKENTNYTVAYEMYDETTESWSVAAAGPKEVGKYRVVITGKGNYSGVAYAEYRITANVLASVLSVSGIKAANYTGEAIEQPAMVVKHGKTVLAEGEHYTVDYIDNIDVGTATVVITAVEGSGYEGTKEVTFKINGTKLNASMIKGFAANVAYNGGEHTQRDMYLVNKNVTLTENVDYTVSYEANTVSGTAEVTVTGMGGYTGSVTKTFTIGTKLAASMLKNFKASVKYFDTVNDDGYVEQPEDELKVTVKIDGVSTVVTLTEGVDYTATYTNNDKAGTATIVYEGMGAYYGAFKKTFKIAATAFSTKLMEVNCWTDAFTYTGSNIEQPNYDLYYNGICLIEGEDYTVTYGNNLKAGKATVTFKGITGYSGSYSKTFVINKVNAENTDVVDIYMPEEVVYTKGAAIAEPVITYGDITLVKGTDYTVAYKNHTKQGTATATITFKGNYTGKVTKTYTITASNLGNVTVTAADKVFSNKVNAYKVTPKLVDVNNKALSAGADYDKAFVYTYGEDVQLANGIVRNAGDTVGAKDIVPAGATIRVTVMGKGNYAGETYVTYRITQSTVASASVAVEVQNYTGKAVELDKNQITVKVGKTELDNTDYEIIGYENNTKIGTAKVTIKGVGNYGGTKTVTFKIQAKSAKTVIKFMPNGGSGSVASMNVMNNDVQLNSIINIKGKQTLARKGYEFVGWNTEKDGTGDKYADADTFFASDRGNARTIHLYAQWNRVEYTITYVGVEDAVNSNPETYNVDTVTFKLENPSKEGYKFEGWYTNSNLKSGKTVQIAKGSTGDKVFYAKWKAL